MAEPNKDEGQITLPENWNELPEVKELLTNSVKDAVLRETSGLKKKNDELLGEVKKFKEIAKRFEDITDPEAAKEALEKMRELEDKKLMDSGEIDKLFEKKTERMREDHERLAKSQSDKIEALEREVKTYKDKLGEVTIEGGIRDAVLGLKDAKVHDSAWPDITWRGKQVFRLNEKGEPEPRDENGNIIYGKDASTPITFTEWAESMIEKASHWWVAGNKGGAGGLPSDPSSRKGKTLETLLNEAVERKDLQEQIRLKRLIANAKQQRAA